MPRNPPFVGPSMIIVALVFVAKGHWQALTFVGIGLLITGWQLSGRKPLVQPTPQRQRRPLTEAVRHEVWRRDQGRCVDCHGRERLEYDHIVPLSRGGSSTARNVELRCETCNRSKGAKV